MLRTAVLSCLVASSVPLVACAADSATTSRPRPAKPATVKIVAFNDYHGNLQTPGTFGANTSIPSTQRPPVGGAEFLRAYVQRMKTQNPNTVVVGAGDFVGATPLISALFHDEPAVETLNRIGVEFTSVGNHEFDKGVDELLRLQRGGCRRVDGVQDPNSCQGAIVGTPVPFEGARFRWLSANVISQKTGRPLLRPYAIREFRNDVKVAFIGMTLKGTPQIVTPSGVAGLEFRDEADTVNALVPRLRAEGADAIVVLVHQGGFQSSGVSDINGCDGNLANSDLAAIVKRLDDAVDLVISGHTHAAYNCSPNTVDVRSSNGTITSTPRPTGLPNAAGRLVPATSASAFGRVLTEIDLTVDRRTHRVSAVSPTNRLVDRTDASIVADIDADPSLRNVVAGYNALVSPIANQVIGSITQALPNSANADGEMPAGSLIADAQLAATQPESLGGAAMAFMNPGGVRNPGFTFTSSAAGEGDGNVTYGEAFTVQPFGNSLVTMTLTNQQLKDLLEQQFPGCLGQGTQRILQVSNGIRYAWSASAAPCSKIVDFGFTPTDTTVVPPVATGPAEPIVVAGVVQNPGKTRRVTVNNFMATGGDGFTTLVGGGVQLGGAQDIDALTAYMAGFKSPAAPYDPTAVVRGEPRIMRLP